MATMQIPAMGYGLRYEYGMFKQSINHGGSRNHLTTGYAGLTHGKLRVRMRQLR